MSFDYNILISSTFGDYTRSFLSGSESATYYIHDFENQDIEIAYGEADTVSHTSSNENYIRSIFNNLDPFISLDFTEVFTANDATFRVYSVSDFSGWDDSTFGEVSNNTNYWDILWRDSYSDTDFNRNTIIHEIGHSLGLSHPNEDPTNPLWDSDITVMSYNKGINGWNTSFSSNDLQALRLIWGSEENGIPQNIQITDGQEIDDDIPLVDDFAQDSSTLGSIDAGETVNGSIENPGDRDWFSLDLTAGEILQLQLTGRSSTSKICPCFSCNQKYNNTNLNSSKTIDEGNNLFLGSFLRDPFLRLYNSDGELLYSDDDSGIDLNSLIQFKAEYTGRYFASASSFSDNDRGDYSLSLSLDDYSSDVSTTGLLNYGEEILGNLEVAGDKDWFAFYTDEGDDFQIDLIGNSLEDSYLNLYNQDGELVSSNDDASQNDFNSRINFTSTYTGNFFVSVEGFKNRYAGSYSLSVDLLSLNETDNNTETDLNSIDLNLSDLEALNYIASNVDLINVFGTNIEAAKDHYIVHGYSEGRSTDSFSALNYLNNYSDLSNVFADNLEAAIRHFITNGYKEGRTDLDIDNNMKIELSSLNYLSINNYSMKKINQERKIINPLLSNINHEQQNNFNSNVIEALNNHQNLNYTNRLFGIDKQF